MSELKGNDERLLHRVYYSNLTEQDKTEINDMLIMKIGLKIFLDQAVQSGLPYLPTNQLVKLLSKLEPVNISSKEESKV